MKLKYIYIVLLALAVMSCRTGKNTLGYFNDAMISGEGTLIPADYSIKLEPNDEIRIVVSSTVPEASAQFNALMPSDAGKNETENMGNSRIMTYKVDKHGDIDFPGLGTMHVAGMTTMQLKAELVARISKMVKDPLVTVDLINFKVNVLGEVDKPQIVEVDKERFSVLEALTACGDLTEYGERESVLVMRTREDGVVEYGVLNLRDTDMMKSPYFYLKQNDVVYVKPNGIKSDNSKYNQNNGYKLSVISTIVSAASVISSLIIALSLK